MYLVKIEHCFCDLGSHFEALESVLLIFFLVYTSKKYYQTDSCAPKCLPWVTKTVMYLVKIEHCFCDLGSHFEALESVLLIFFLFYASKKYDQTDSCAPKCLHQITKIVLYIVLNTTLFMWPRESFWGPQFSFTNIFSRLRLEKIWSNWLSCLKMPTLGHKNSDVNS
jgi:hypothetical protein